MRLEREMKRRGYRYETRGCKGERRGTGWTREEARESEGVQAGQERVNRKTTERRVTCQLPGNKQVNGGNWPNKRGVGKCRIKIYLYLNECAKVVW